MKTPALITAFVLSAIALQAREANTVNAASAQKNETQHSPVFIENKGQITDQHGAVRKDIDYKLSGGDVTLFVGDGQLHYQWSRAKANSKNEKLNTKSLANRKSPSGPAAAGRDAGIVDIYRMDVTLLGADKNAVAVAEDMQRYYENYYLPTTPDGATAHSYKKITYKNVYPHIDWVLYTPATPEGGSLATGGIKYDFIVHPGGNVADIQLQYNGATKLDIENGALVAATPMGSITEEAPYCYMAGSKELVASHYVLEGNVLRYDVAATPANSTLVIDPALQWATYYGGTGTEQQNGCSADTAGNVYIAGHTPSTGNIATTGAYQTSYGGGSNDVYIAKFNRQGAIQWATYYGGSGNETCYDIDVHASGEGYVSISTQSTGLASTGAYQAAFGGGTGDALLLKLNANGTRQWATYYGGAANETGSGVCVMPNGDVCFYTIDMPAGFGTAGTFAPTATLGGTGMLTRFTATGSRLWATYYHNEGGTLCADSKGNAYVVITATLSSVYGTTAGAHQASLAGGNDGYITKFGPTGNRLWATYYGGSSADYINYIACDAIGNVYIAGHTHSNTGIATPGSHQPTFTGTGIPNGMLAKFDSTGVRQWGTYYGANASNINTAGIVCDPKNNVHTIMTMPIAGMATSNAYKTTISGAADALWSYFNPAGQLQYATYFGGNGNDGSLGYGNIAYGKGSIYFAGATPSTTGLATTGAYQTSLSGAIDAFVARFDMDTFLYINQPFTDTIVCSGDTLSIPYGVTQSFRSSNNFIFELSNAAGSFASGVTTLGTLTAAQTGGVYNYVVPHSTTQSNLYRVRVRATAPLDTGTEVANIRITTTPQSPTATNNGPVCSGTSLNLASSSTTAGVSYSWSGPGGYTSTAQNPVRNPGYTKYSGDYIVTISNNGCISKDTTTAAVDSTPIAITAGNNGPLCVGSDLQLTATNTSAGATYNWSGPSFSNTTQNPTINNVGLANAGVYSVYASLGNCNTATVTTTVSVVNGPSVNIYPSPNDSICGNTTGSATFVATAVNPGGSPSYQWYKNGTLVATTTGNTYAATGIQTGDVFYTKLVPGTGAACNTPVNSNQINMTVMPYLTPSVSISVSPDSTTWSGVMLTFTATVANAGNNPKYQWKLNGVSVVGALSNVWGAPNLNDKDKVTCEVTSSYICPQPQKVTSNVITLKVKTGINKVEANNISIYPNPTQTTLTVEGVTKGTIIQLKDVLGRQVIYTTATNSKTVLNTSQLTAGNYLLVLTTTTGEVLTERVVKE
jgi:hypothetical protein